DPHAARRERIADLRGAGGGDVESELCLERAVFDHSGGLLCALATERQRSSPSESVAEGDSRMVPGPVCSGNSQPPRGRRARGWAGNRVGGIRFAVGCVSAGRAGAASVGGRSVSGNGGWLSAECLSVAVHSRPVYLVRRN